MKKKLCKSIGKATGFNGCGKLTFQRTYGLGHSCGCYPKWLLNTPEGKEKLNKSIFTATQPRRDLNQAFENKKDKNKLGLLLEVARVTCHTYIRLRDKGKPCISCGRPYSPDFHAGHYKKAEIYSNLKYWEYNINGQCIKCNINEDGNVTEYGHRLPDRIGKDKAQEVEQMAKDFKKMNWKWDREELKKIKKSYQYKIKQLKQNETN